MNRARNNTPHYSPDAHTVSGEDAGLTLDPDELHSLLSLVWDALCAAMADGDLERTGLWIRTYLKLDRLSWEQAAQQKYNLPPTLPCKAIWEEWWAVRKGARR